MCGFMLMNVLVIKDVFILSSSIIIINGSIVVAVVVQCSRDVQH